MRIALSNMVIGVDGLRIARSNMVIGVDGLRIAISNMVIGALLICALFDSMDRQKNITTHRTTMTNTPPPVRLQ